MSLISIYNFSSIIKRSEPKTPEAAPADPPEKPEELQPQHRQQQSYSPDRYIRNKILKILRSEASGVVSDSLYSEFVSSNRDNVIAEVRKLIDEGKIEYEDRFVTTGERAAIRLVYRLTDKFRGE